MTKKNTKPAGRPAADPDEGEEGAGLAPAGADQEEDEDPLPWEEDFQAWEASERVDESTLIVTLYRFPKGGKGKERVWRWTDEIPDEHEIGLQFGGGSYIIYATVSGPGGYRKVRHRRFVLAASYGAGRVRALQEPGANPYPLAGSVPAGGPAYAPNPYGPELMFGLLERLIVAALSGRQAAPAAPDLSHWTQANEIVGSVVKSAAESQLKLSREVSNHLAGAKGAEVESEADDGDFKDYLKDMIKEYGPTLLEAAGLKLKAAAGLVKRDEVFQSLAGNNALFGRVLNLLAKDPEVDKGLAEKVLTKLQGIGVAVPLPPGFSFQQRPGALNGSAMANHGGSGG